MYYNRPIRAQKLVDLNYSNLKKSSQKKKKGKRK